MEEERIESIFIKGERPDVGCILVHGFTGTPFSVGSIPEIIAEHGITAYVPLLAGHGTSEYDLENVTHEDWLNDVREAYDKLKALGCKDIIVYGQSLGGLLTLNFAEMEPDLKGIIVLCAPLRAHDNSMFYRWKEYKKLRFREFPKPPGAAGKSDPKLGYNSFPTIKEKEICILMRKAEKNLAKIECPMLAVYSKKDHLVKAKSAAILCKRTNSKKKELLILSKSGHSISRGPEKEKVEAKIHSFLTNLGYPQIEK